MSSAVRDEPDMVPVCDLADVAHGQVHPATVGKVRVVAVRLDDTVRVFRAVCPHQGAPLDSSWIRPALTSDTPGQIHANQASPVLICPWHSFEFDVGDGRCLFSKLKLKSYPAEIRDGQIWARIRTSRPSERAGTA